MKALIIGMDGPIGNALGKFLRNSGHDVVGTTRKSEKVGKQIVYLDLDDDASLAADFAKNDVAFFCAAMTKYEDCRNDEQRAQRINAANPTAIAKRLVESGSRVVLLSTSAVLDCRSPRMAADRPTCPASAYGRTKAKAETAFLALGPKASVLRLTKVLTPDTGKFPKWIGDLSKGLSIECADDFRFAPIKLDHVVHALGSIGGQQEGGVFQVSSDSDISYADAAWHLADRINAPRQLVQGRSSTSLNIDADAVTAYTSLDTTRLGKMFSFVPPDPRDVIDDVMEAAFAAARQATVMRT